MADGGKFGGESWRRRKNIYIYKIMLIIIINIKSIEGDDVFRYSADLTDVFWCQFVLFTHLILSFENKWKLNIVYEY